MFKRFAPATRITTAILMVVSILMPTTVAEASGTITKQITVLGFDGQPYAGAQVAMGYQPTTGSFARTAFTATQISNSSGVVTLQYPDNSEGLTLIIQPPATDTLTAGYSDWASDFLSSSPLTATLETASVAIRILNTNGQDAESGAGIYDGYKNYIQTLRTGVVGINIPDTAMEGECVMLEVNPRDNGANSRKRYATKVTGTGNSRIVRVYTDADTCLVEAPKINGVYQLSLAGSNISGTLKSATGQSLSLSTAATFKVEALPINTDGTVNYNNAIASSYAGNDGSWAISVDTATAGKYLLSFAGFGDPALPIFADNYLYVTSDHKLSWNQDGSASANSLTLTRNIPVPNITFALVDSVTSQGLPNYFNISKLITSPDTWLEFANSQPADGRSSAYLADGTYMAWLGGFNNGSNMLKFSVSGSTITVLTTDGFTYSRSGNNFTFLKPASNVKLRVLDATDAPVRSYADFCWKSCYTGQSDSTGLIELYVANGTYSNVNVMPINNSNLATISISGTVTNGVASITGATAGNNGEWIVRIPASNFKAKLINPTNNKRLYGVAPFIYLRNSDGTNGNQVTRLNMTSMGTVGTFLANGNYNFVLNVYSGVSENFNLASKTYRISVSGGVVTTSYAGTEVVPSDGFVTLTPHVANFMGVLKDPSGNAITSGSIQIVNVAQNGTQSNSRNTNTNNLGQFYAYLEDGTSKITVNPSENYSTLAKKNYTATTSGGVTTVSGATKDGTTWILPVETANVLVTAINAKTTLASNAYWISVENATDAWNSNGWVENIDLYSANPGYGRTVLPNGKYLFVVNPHENTENIGLAPQTYRVIVADSGVTVSLGSTAIQAVNGRFPLEAASSNFEILVKKPNGTVFSDGWVDFCKVIDQYNSNCRGQWLRNDGTYSNYLTDGTWKVTVHPADGHTDITEKSYTVTVTSGVPAIAGLTATNNVWTLFTGTPNFSGTFSTSSGPLVFTGNQNIGLDLEKYENGKWQYQGINAWSRSENWAMTINVGAGRYRFSVNPWNFADLVKGTSDEFWVNGSGQFSLTETGTATDSITAFNIILKSPNLKFKVINPLAQPADANYLLPGGWINIEKVAGQNRNWVTNADIQPANPGLTGANIVEPGNYILRVNPPNGSSSVVGLAAKDYQMTIVSAESVTVASGGVEVAKDSDGRFVLRLATANVTARILRTDGTPATPGNNKWVGVNLQRLNSYGDWQWGGWANTDDNGYVSLRVDEAGKYRLRIEPYGDSQASVTYSTEFTVTADQIDTLDKKFGSITLAGPSIRVSVAVSTAPTVPIANASIEIRKDGRWIDWANTGQGGVAGVSLTSEGTYEFTVHPNQEQLTQAAKKTYKVVATKNSDGQIVATVTSGTGVSVSGTVTTLLLGTPTLVGTVKDPDGVTLQANSQVYAVDLASGSEKWDYSVNTNNNGVWSMILPAGRYKIFARAPWGTSTYGTSSGIGEVVVAENGTVTTPAGYPANAFEIRLKAPTWSGTVKAPTGDTVIPGARVCLLISNIWNCTNADTAGHFALSMADSFSSFSNTNPILDIADDQGRNYPMNRIQGESNVSNALNGIQSNSVVLRLKAPNTEITVTPSEGTLVASNLWVVAERDGIGYLGSGTTDMNGVAKLNIDQPNLPFKVRVEVTGNQEIAANFAPATRTYTQLEITNGTSSSVFRGSITLSPPNFRFIVREPTTAGTAVGNTWVELLGGNDGPWLGGTSVDFNGFGNFKLDVPQTGVNNYVMIVNPAWNATTNFTRQAYAVTVASSGNITVTNKTSVTEVRTQSASGKTVYPLALGIPSVTGIVVDPDSRTVANSWVVPFNGTTNEGYWQQGVTSRNDGSIAMNLAAGSYKLEANVPWGVSGVAKSAQCAVTVANGTISTGGSCVQSGTPNTVRLQLRAPNVKFTLKVGNSVIANANVGVGAGKWWTNAQSNSEGVVSLFIDAAAIRELNGSSSAQRLWFWVDPPYGSSTMARWSCGSTDNKPICKDLTDVPTTGDYVGKVSENGSAWVVQGVTPNTRLKIVDPVTSTELANSWVSVLAMNSQGYQWWLGGGNSGIDGYVAMNLETETAYANGYNKLVVEVQAPWNQRSTFATNLYNYGGLGYTYESLTALADFSPATPNLKLVIKDSNNYINRYGWVGVEDVTNINATKWVGGYGLNEYGEGAVFLSASKTYRITSYPGPGRGGAATTCLVTTGNQTPPVVTADSAGCGSRTVTNGSLTIRLNGGNVVGTVTRADGTPVVGAAVYANIPGAATEASAVITVTDETGHYDLQLTAGQSWNLKVFPIPSTTDNLEIQTYPAAITAPAIGASTIDFTLAAVVG